MPKKKLGKHLQFYMDCMIADCKMPKIGYSNINGGLCRAVAQGDLSENIFKLFSCGQGIYSYWAHIGDGHSYASAYEFNPLRQTIVLFMAAISGEL